MKHLLVVVIALSFASILTGQVLTPRDEGSAVKFTIKNFGFNVTGSFTGLQGKIEFNPDEPAKSFFDVSVDAASINTGIEMRDEHLRSEEYFDAKNHSRIHFVSTRITASNKAGTLFVFGKLTIRNTTKEISFPFTAQPQGDGYLFSGDFKIKRKDFGIGGSGPVSNELTVNLSVFAKK